MAISFRDAARRRRTKLTISHRHHAHAAARRAAVASALTSRGFGMTGLWYYGRGDELFGPFSGWQVAELADAGEVRTTDTVWEDANEDGVPAHTIPHLFPAAVPAVAVPAAVEPPTWQRAAAVPRRAVAGSGAVIVGQDGTTVRYRKKCKTCGKEDQSTSTAAIVRGTMRFGYFCPKCRKRSPVEIQGR